MTSPNPEQQRLIDSLDGVYRVDAGPGTGKTFTITRRYANLLETRDVAPDDVLLVTFTRNAAAEMRTRIARESAYRVTELHDAPISTFHAYANRLLRRYGHTVPERLGLTSRVSASVDLIEDDVRERALFRTFVSRFEADHPEYHDLFAVLSDPAGLRSLIAQLAAKGVIPTADGWYRETRALLEGDREGFREAFVEANRPNEGASGPTQSDARSGIGSRLSPDMAAYPPTAPAFDELLDDLQADEDAVMRAFDEDRETLVAFVHDLYLEYLAFALERDYLTHGLVLVLAFVLLMEDDGVREVVQHDYVMIDEFQDTNELQFKLTLLLAGRANVCVVGDWKQSIYGFQYTEVENIRTFEPRLRRFVEQLNSDRERVPAALAGMAVEPLSLRRNYRSTQSVIEFAEESLKIPATGGEEIDADAVAEQVTHLESTSHVDNSRIEAVSHDEEALAVLDRLQHVVGNDAYAVEVSDEPRPPDDAPEGEHLAAEQARLGPPSYDDIAVFTRTHAFARELIASAEEYGIPMTYEGGVEVFDTDQAKLLLAWLRVVEADDERGWAVVLEEAGYALPQAKARLESGDYPDTMAQFAGELEGFDTVGGLAQRVFDRYGFDDAYADALLDELTGLHGASIYTRGEAIEFLRANLEDGATADVDLDTGVDAVTLQTIHAAKGLEYPIVILANVNQRTFPNFGGRSSRPIQYDELLGIRQTRVFEAGDGRPFVFKHWPWDVLTGSQSSSYDEERRLLFVALSRAKRHLLITAGETPSRFFEGLPVEPTAIEPAVEPVETDAPAAEPLGVTAPSAMGPVRAGVHDIMDDSVYEAVTEGEGSAFGSALHDFAEAHALGEDVEPSGRGLEEQRRTAAFIDAFDGERHVEAPVLCPLDGEPRVVLTGIIDLLHVTGDRVDLIDYKTDRGRVAHEEYQIQLSVYAHVLASIYPGRGIRPLVYYTADDEAVEIERLSAAELRAIAEERLELA